MPGFRPGRIEDISEEVFREVMRTNLDSVFFGTQAAVPAMKRQGGGHIVQISTSLVGTRAADRSGGGCVAVEGRLRRRYARPGDGTGVKQHPGQCDLARHCHYAVHDGFRPRGVALVLPLNRNGKIEDVVRAMNYLEDADYVTGEIHYVDGGRTAGH